jgi:LysR family malonate utilization transcriptional regulator
LSTVSFRTVASTAACVSVDTQAEALPQREPLTINLAHHDIVRLVIHRGVHVMSPPRISEEITIRKLEILLAYLEAGNLAATAERLGTSTVSIHRALHSLEEGLRCRLFRPEGRNLVPTDAGLALADVAREALALLTEGVAATRAAGGYAAEQIRIGTLYSLTVRAVPQLVIDMKARRPDLHMELAMGSNADLLDQLRQGRIDAALMALPAGESDIETVSLFHDELCFAARAGSIYAAMTEIDLASCRNERFVSLTDGFVSQRSSIDAFRAAGFEPNIAMKVDDIFSLMNMVGGGIGCALLPGRVRDAFSERVQLLPLQAKYRMRQTIVLAFLRSRERDPNLLALSSLCRQSARRHELRLSA